MKKILILVLAFTYAAFAFSAEIAIGGRGNFNWDVGTSLARDGDTLFKALRQAGASYSLYDNIGGGVGVYGNIELFDADRVKLALQPEIDLNFNNGINSKVNTGYKNSSVTIATTTLDIPLLLMVDFPVNKSVVGIGLGPQVSFPLAFFAATNSNGIINDYGNTLNFDGFNFGFAFDIHAKFHIGNSIAFVPNLRYNLDVTPTKAQETVGWVEYHYELFVRRGMCVGLGVEYHL